MKLPPDVETRGLKAYEQAAAFERLRGWRLGLSYVVFTLIPLLNGMLMWKSGHTTLALLHFLLVLFFVAGCWFHWRGLRARYAKNLAVLAELEAMYGDQLPWIEVEKHFAAVEELRRELANEKKG